MRLIGCVAILLFGFGIAASHAETDQRIIDDAVNDFRASLKDPESAQFEELQIHRVNYEAGERVCVTGEVNAKNSFGGYVGFQPFLSAFRDGEVEHFMNPSEGIGCPISAEICHLDSMKYCGLSLR